MDYEQKLTELYARLVMNGFSFLDQGWHRLKDIQTSVKSLYPELCDDDETKNDRYAHPATHPEWHDKVRDALDALRKKGRVRNDPAIRRSEWEILEGISRSMFPDEMGDSQPLSEGALVTVSRHERNQQARQACIAAKGTACSVCGFDLASLYGPVAQGLIHIHHLKPFTGSGERTVDPIADLVPVCPNCHAFLHYSGKLLNIEEAKTHLIASHWPNFPRRDAT